MEKDRLSDTVVLSFSVPEKTKKKKTGAKSPKPAVIPAIMPKLKTSKEVH